jgi:intein/homing endonuclease
MRKYTLNENFFEKIDSEQKAYWLGFISADGTIVVTNKQTNSLRLRINIHEKDRNLLEMFKEDLESDSPIKEYVTNKNKKFESKQVKIDINSKKICNDLFKLGITSNKTNTLTMPNIPINMLQHFIRGYFDGDGCFNYYKNKTNNGYKFCFEVVGNSIGILHSIQTIFQENNIVTTIYTRKNNNSYRLMTCNKNQIKLIIKYMYKNSNVYLNRKFLKAQEMLNIAC